ncbi:MAG: hypothetical protein HY909_26965 [Deltaproteobacteria bacterium]|nr:hypothetical protein [Deltaproteobacteria bacterium]
MRRALGLAILGACSSQTSLAVVVVAPDGGDPFHPPDGATVARFTVEDMATPPRMVPVDPRGAFSFTVEISRPEVASRLVLEALHDGVVVGSGATPPLVWGTLGPALVPLFVQRRDSVVPAPWGSSLARVRPSLVAVRGGFVAVLGGASGNAPIEVFDPFGLRVVPGGASLDGMVDRDASTLVLGDGKLLFVRGCLALTWQPASNTVERPSALPPEGRCAVLGSTVVREPSGGGLVLGGHTAMGPVARVDRVLPDGTWAEAPALATPRDRPSALRLGLQHVLLAGGQAPSAPLLEQYGLARESLRGVVRTGDDRVDARVGAVLADAGDGVALVLGGAVAGSTDLAAEDALVDTRCLAGGCAALVRVEALLRARRRDALAVSDERGQVLVLSGLGVGGVADAVEVLDVASPRAPVARGPVGSLAYTDLSALTLATGSVLITGGGQPSSWLYRH